MLTKLTFNEIFNDIVKKNLSLNYRHVCMYLIACKKFDPLIYYNNHLNKMYTRKTGFFKKINGVLYLLRLTFCFLFLR